MHLSNQLKCRWLFGSLGLISLVRYHAVSLHSCPDFLPSCLVSLQQLRPIIDPIGQLPEFLLRLKRAEDAKEAGKL
jgi:hypothetical protein